MASFTQLLNPGILTLLKGYPVHLKPVFPQVTGNNLYFCGYKYKCKLWKPNLSRIKSYRNRVPHDFGVWKNIALFVLKFTVLEDHRQWDDARKVTGCLGEQVRVFM